MSISRLAQWNRCRAYQGQGNQIIVKVGRSNDDGFGCSACDDNQNGGYKEKCGHNLDGRRDTCIHCLMCQWVSLAKDTKLDVSINPYASVSRCQSQGVLPKKLERAGETSGGMPR